MGLCITTIFKDCERKPQQEPLLQSSEQDTTAKTQQLDSPTPAKLNDFKFLKTIGMGAQGKVLLVQHKKTSKLYAMKILEKSLLKLQGQQNYARSEKSILQQVKSPFIIRLHFAFQDNQKLYLGTEFANGGELFTHLRRAQRFEEGRAKFYAAEIVLALKCLHENGIIYRDLKPENLLLDMYGHIKVADFGLSKMELSKQEFKKAYTQCGTAEYVAPEILTDDEGYNECVDWYSLGILIYEMMSGAPPFYSQDKKKMVEDRMTKPIEMLDCFSSDTKLILRGLLELEPTNRLGNRGADELMQHCFFKDIDWIKLAKREIEPPYKPIITGMMDLQYFDQQFLEQPMMVDASKDVSKTTAEKYDGYTFYNLNETDIQIMKVD